MADKYDLVIFGSTAAARLLALSLSTQHEMKVLVIVDPDQAHWLPPTPQLSAGYCTSPLFLSRAAQGAAAVQHLLAPYRSELLLQAKPTSVFAQQKQHLPLLEFAEGAAIHADIVCERRVHETTDGEQLVFPEAVRFNTAEIVRAIDSVEAQKQPFTLVARAEIEKSHITRDGRYSGRTAAQLFKADRVLMLDQDLIHDELKAHPQDTPIMPQWQHIIRFHQQKAPIFASQLDVSTGLWQYEMGTNDVLFSAPGSMDQLATHLFKYHGEIVDRRVQQFDQIRMMSLRDGYPICDVLGERQIICFAGAQQFELALAPELAAHLSQTLGSKSSRDDPFWTHAQLGSARGGDGSLLRAGDVQYA